MLLEHAGEDAKEDVEEGVVRIVAHGNAVIARVTCPTMIV